MSYSRNEPVVWCPQESNQDLREAEKYGMVEFVTTEEFHAVAEMVIRTDINKAVQDYYPGKDFLCPVGSLLLWGLFFAEIVRVYPMKQFDHKILKWDNRTKTYSILIVGKVWNLA